MLLYDAIVVAIFLMSRFGMGLCGLGLWSAVAAHSGLGMCSASCLATAGPRSILA